MNEVMSNVFTATQLKGLVQGINGKVELIDCAVDIVIALNKETGELKFSEPSTEDSNILNPYFEHVKGYVSNGENLTPAELKTVLFECKLHSLKITDDNDVLEEKHTFLKSADEELFTPNTYINLENHVIPKDDILLIMAIELKMDGRGELVIQPKKHYVYADDTFPKEEVARLSDISSMETLDSFLDKNHQAICDKVFRVIELSREVF